MTRLRFSLRQLLGLVVLLGVGFGISRFYWRTGMGAWPVIYVAYVWLAVIAAFFSRPINRAFWIGWVMMAIVYLFVIERWDDTDGYEPFLIRCIAAVGADPEINFDPAHHSISWKILFFGFHLFFMYMVACVGGLVGQSTFWFGRVLWAYIAHWRSARDR